MKCKWCKEEAKVDTYRDNCGVVGRAMECVACVLLPTEVLNLRVYDFEEGDDYWALELVKGKYHLSESCWDDISEELDNPNVFRNLEDGLTFLNAIGEKEVVVGRMRFFEVYTLNIELIIK